MLVDRLERAGWVERTPHHSDRLIVLVELSPQALERVPAGLTVYHARIRAIAGNVPVCHRDAIRSFLQAAAEAASSAVGDLRRPGPGGRASG